MTVTIVTVTMDYMTCDCNYGVTVTMDYVTYNSFIAEVSKTLKVDSGKDCFPLYYADLAGGRSTVVFNVKDNVCKVHTPLGVINWVNFGKNKGRKSWISWTVSDKLDS